jgi:hypothetical protein
MSRPPEPEPKGSLLPPNRRPPTALGADLLPPREEPSGPTASTRRPARPWLFRAINGVFWLLDRIGEDLARGLGLREKETHALSRDRTLP